jgi:sulfate transport system permease protein
MSAARGQTGALLLRAVVAAWLVGLVGVPLGTLVVRALQADGGVWAATLGSPVARAALWLSLWTSALCAVLNGVMGLLVAWALARWQFPGRKVIAALVDLPLAVPTLVTGVVIVALYGPQTALGGALASAGAPVAFAPPGILLALLFVTLPLVVRAVEPVLHELDPAEEEAASMLGADRLTTLRRVLLPPLYPALAAGMVQTFARATAEFGSLSVVSGNIPFQTLTAPVYVLGEIEGGNVPGATVASLVLLAFALTLHGAGVALARRSGVRHA